MTTPQFLPTLTPRTVAIARELMHRDGRDHSDGSQVALYVERLVVRTRLFRTVAEIRDLTKVIPEAELQRMIDEAIEATRSDGHAP